MVAFSRCNYSITLRTVHASHESPDGALRLGSGALRLMTLAEVKSTGDTPSDAPCMACTSSEGMPRGAMLQFVGRLGGDGSNVQLFVALAVTGTSGVAEGMYAWSVPDPILA